MGKTIDIGVDVNAISAAKSIAETVYIISLTVICIV